MYDMQVRYEAETKATEAAAKASEQKRIAAEAKTQKLEEKLRQLERDVISQQRNAHEVPACPNLSMRECLADVSSRSELSVYVINAHCVAVCSPEIFRQSNGGEDFPAIWGHF